MARSRHHARLPSTRPLTCGPRRTGQPSSGPPSIISRSRRVTGRSSPQQGRPALPAPRVRPPALRAQPPAPPGSQGPGLLLEANGTFVPLPLSSTNVYAIPAGSLIITSDGNLVSPPAGTYVTPYGLITVTQAPGG